jgi:hypothetical protein
MSRFGCVLSVLVATAGCGATALTPSVPSGTPAGVALEGQVLLAPETAAVARSIPAAGRRNRVAGYYWVGYTPADFGTGDLRSFGSGDGFTFGLGLAFGEAGRTFLEIAFEKTVNHSYAPLLELATPATNTGNLQRLLIGGRTTATAIARMERQPRPYISYGFANNECYVDVASGSSYKTSGLGGYVGLGVEYPLAQKMSFSFDSRYHVWSDTDSDGVDGTFSNVAVSLLWLGRF